MAGLKPKLHAGRPAQPFLPPLPHTHPHELTSSGASPSPLPVSSSATPSVSPAPPSQPGESRPSTFGPTRPAGASTYKAMAAIGRARGMKPLTQTVKAAQTSSAPPSSSAVTGGSASDSLDVANTVDGGMEGGTPSHAFPSPHPPPPRLRAHNSQLSPKSITAAERGGRRGTVEQPPPPPPPPNAGAASPAALYRPTSLQFVKAVQRLNRMTASACHTDDTTSFEVVAAPGQGRKRSGAGAMRRMLHVPLLPLTVCTDGTTVVLVDHNGTSRHGNYVAAVASYLRRRAADESGVGASGVVSSNTAPTRVLWWTASDVRNGAGTLTLSNARAMYDAGGSSSPSSESLRGVQPDRLALPYGEALVLVLTTNAVTLAGTSQETLRENVPLAEGGAEVLSHVSHRPTSICGDFLRDLCHGYLPSLLESAYPDGGVQLRGCWCDVDPHNGSTEGTAKCSLACLSSTRHASLPASTAVKPTALSGSAKREMDDAVATVCVTQPLVHFSSTSAGSSESGSTAKAASAAAAAAAAAAARTMQSLRPTSLPPPKGRSRESSLVDGGLPEWLVELPEAVLRFVLPPEAPSSQDHTAAGVSGQHTVRGSPTIETTSSTQGEEAVIGGDARAFTATPPTLLRSTLTLACPLLRTPAPEASSASAAIKPAPNAARCDDVGGCPSVVVLTPMGRVELVASAATTAPPLSAPLTIRDVKRSLLRSTVGQSLQLSEGAVALVYAPGTPALRDDVLLTGQHVVLRLRCRQATEGKSASGGAASAPPTRSTE